MPHTSFSAILLTIKSSAGGGCFLPGLKASTLTSLGDHTPLLAQVRRTAADVKQFGSLAQVPNYKPPEPALPVQASTTPPNAWAKALA